VYCGIKEEIDCLLLKDPIMSGVAVAPEVVARQQPECGKVRREGRYLVSEAKVDLPGTGSLSSYTRQNWLLCSVAFLKIIPLQYVFHGYII
jgi:hypothetical protein